MPLRKFAWLVVAVEQGASSFVSAARSRIRWLEDIIRERLPDVDLRSGPQIEPASESTVRSQEERAPEEAGVSVSPGPAVSAVPRKRSAEVSGQYTEDEPFTERAYTVAQNLGMLSLNIDSPQKHYLGSSSGLLFTNLIGASPPNAESTPEGSGGYVHAGDLEWHDHVSALDYNRKYHRELYNLLKQELPTKHNALVLAHTYIRWIHPDFPFLEPVSLFSAIEAIYSCLDGIMESDVLPHGWPSTMPSFRWNGRMIVPGIPNDEGITLSVVMFNLFMVFNISALVKVRSRNYDFPPQRFYRAALHFSKDSFSHTTLSSIQALIMLITHSMLTPAEVNLWTLVHLGLAYCVEIGIHREQSQINREDFAFQQVRRFTFFTIYSLDRSISSIQGRPLGFRDETFDVKMPQALLSEDENLQGTMQPFFMSAVTHYSTYHFNLDRIISDIKLHLYHLPGDSSCFPWPENPTEQQNKIRETLNSWWEEASHDPFDFRSLESRQREVWRLKLKIKYHTTMVLLFQPSQVIRQPTPEALQICFDSAASILDGYQRLHDLHSLHFEWRAVQNIFAAGATLIYSFWTCQSIRKKTSQTDLSRNLRSCSTLLTIGGEWWPSAKGGQTSFGSVADLTMRRLYIEDASNKAPRLYVHSSATDQPRERPESTVYGAQSLETLDHLHPVEGDPAWQGLGVNVEENPVQFPWPGMEAGFDPEIEMFLADFNRSEFTWNFALNGNQDFDPFGANQNSGF
ncbi:unnamed protein product [Fusarium equiseti]|uniref:Xylanolytic transcriptional activator regulatory domain-containing protein n=1 Tax=Fusarium equiseti TaxID=61235 RepID=A0A8J2IPX3_FUSEQ|nr:unnamed protein product [Fusarium equiseti]